MDWNLKNLSCLMRSNVTLHTESMDWNLLKKIHLSRITRYSPHGEYGLKSVVSAIDTTEPALLSTRRVWIEIAQYASSVTNSLCYSPHGEYGLKLVYQKRYLMTLAGYSPHGEYGLKSPLRAALFCFHWLLSTRRVWIEIRFKQANSLPYAVTLHTESMDWNHCMI